MIISHHLCRGTRSDGGLNASTFNQGIGEGIFLAGATHIGRVSKAAPARKIPIPWLKVEALSPASDLVPLHL